LNRARRELEQSAAVLAEEQARGEAEEQARRKAEEQARPKAEEKRWRDAEERVLGRADKQANDDATRRQAEEPAEEQIGRQAEKEAWRRSEERVLRRADERARAAEQRSATPPLETLPKLYGHVAQDRTGEEPFKQVQRPAQSLELGVGKPTWILAAAGLLLLLSMFLPFYAYEGRESRPIVDDWSFLEVIPSIVWQLQRSYAK
jgi:hypothetical protein